MSRVIQIVQHLRPGGIESLALELVRFSSPQDETLVISLEESREQAVAAWSRLSDCADRLVFLNKAPGWQPCLITQLVRLFRRLRPDVVHTHHVGPLIYGGLAARLARVPRLVHTEHDAWHLEDPRRRRLQRLILALTRPRLVADARHVAEALRNHLRGWEPRVILNGIDTERFTPGDRDEARRNLGLPRQARLIGCAARLHPVKGHRFLLDALSALPGDVHLALAGAGEEASALERQSRRLGIERRVHFLGRVDEMPTFYRALDAFCLPSLAEGLPLSTLEAQSSGVPVVVTDAGGSPESACPSSGRVVPAGEVGALAEALLSVLDAPTNADPRAFVRARGDVRATSAAYAAVAV